MNSVTKNNSATCTASIQILTDIHIACLKCNVCKHINDISNTKCVMCNAEISKEKHEANSQSSVSHGNMWKCRVCTFLNEQRDSTCTNCHKECLEQNQNYGKYSFKKNIKVNEYISENWIKVIRGLHSGCYGYLMRDRNRRIYINNHGDYRVAIYTDNLQVLSFWMDPNSIIINSMWKCVQCTFVNEAEQNACAICKTDKTSKDQKDGSIQETIDVSCVVFNGLHRSHEKYILMGAYIAQETARKKKYYRKVSKKKS